MLKYLGFAPTADDVLDFIDETDLDQDGRVSLREFQRFLRVSHRRLPVGTHEHMLVPVSKKGQSEKLKQQFLEARQRRKVQSELTAAVIDGLKREQLEMADEDELMGSANNPSIAEDHVLYSFLVKDFPAKVQCVRGRGERIADQLQGKKKGATGAGGDTEVPLTYFLRLDAGACMRLPVVGKAVDRLASYAVTLAFRVSSIPTSRFPLFTGSKASLVLLSTGHVGIHAKERMTRLPFLADGDQKKDCRECKKPMTYVPAPAEKTQWHHDDDAEEENDTSDEDEDEDDVAVGGGGEGWECDLCSSSGPSDKWVCGDCGTEVCSGCMRPECRVHQNKWTLLTAVVDGNRLSCYVNGTLAAISDIDDGFCLTAEEIRAKTRGGREQKEKWLMAAVFGDPVEKGLCPGCDIRFVRFDTNALDQDAVLTIHVPHGVWRCHMPECHVRNSPSDTSCVACSTARKLSGVAPPNDMDPEHPGLRVVVADSFERMVLNDAKHVFLDVTGDWCGPSR